PPIQQPLFSSNNNITTVTPKERQITTNNTPKSLLTHIPKQKPTSLTNTPSLLPPQPQTPVQKVVESNIVSTTPSGKEIHTQSPKPSGIALTSPRNMGLGSNSASLSKRNQLGPAHVSRTTQR